MAWGRRIATVATMKPMTRRALQELKTGYVDMSKTEQMCELTTKIYTNAIEQAKTTDYRTYEFKPMSSKAPFNAYFMKKNKDEIINYLNLVFPDSKITIGTVSTDIPFAYFPTQESIKIDWS